MARELTGQAPGIDALSGATGWEAAAPSTRMVGSRGEKAAIIPVQGVLTQDGPAYYGTNYQTIADAAEKAAADPDVKRIVLAVDSPGGSVTGLPETAAVLAAVAKIKPMSAVVEGVAASAAYWLTSQASDITLTPSGEVGSVGVRMMHVDQSRALDDAGITVTELHSGDFKTEWSFGATGYVMAAGSIHPSGKPYTVELEATLAAVPDYVLTLRPERGHGVQDNGEPITASRNNALTSIAGKMRNTGMSVEAMELALLQTNADRCQPPLSDSEVRRIAANAAAWKPPTVDAVPTLGGVLAAVSGEPVEPVDWRTRYATKERFQNIQPPSFLIRDFLEDGSITALGAPVAQRKSIVVANVIHALLTGEPLFGHFEVLKLPERILYLCPEMGLVDVANRFKRLGLEKYVGDKLFIRTMDDPRLPLADLDEELPGSLLILDTLTRFVTGNQNDAGDMSKFADVNYAIKRRGATIMLLHHAIKGSGAQSMSLDSALRGSTELAAFVTCVWSTQLQDIDSPHTTPSNLKCVKQRGFASEPFQVSCDENFRMTMLGNMGEIKAQKQATSEAALAAILAESPDMGINKIQEALRAVGHRRGGKWVTAARASIRGMGVTLAG